MQNSENIGFLIVSVTTAINSIPISNALVTISKIVDGVDQTFKSAVTNISGRTEIIALDAEPVEFSLTPSPSSPAFSIYNIHVQKEGYYTANNLNVPIFAGITSIQPVKLIPYTFEKNLTGDNEHSPEGSTVNEAEGPNL